MRRTLVWLIAGIVALLGSLAVAVPAFAYVNWPGYMFNLGHSSLNPAAKTITPANAGALAPAWAAPFSPSENGFEASPVVYNGSIYIGAKNGVFYQLNETTGAIIHSVTLGKDTACTKPTYAYGVEDTATVAPDPDRPGAATVYVTGGNGTSSRGGIYLWALDAKTLKPVSTWRTDPVTVDTQVGALGWAAPVVSNGTISVGIASGCDVPSVRGGLGVFRQSHGTALGTYRTVPAGSLAGPIWSSPAASGSSTWVATGNAAQTRGALQGDSFSIVRLQGATKQDIWTLPGQTGTDNDFGASPTLFTGLVNGTPTPMIGDCNKNGTFYALQSGSLSLGPVWTQQIAASKGGQICNAGAVWDASANQLIMGSTLTSRSPGAIQALSPDAAASNRVIWQSDLPCPVDGVPSEDGAGVLAVVTMTFPGENPCTTGSTPSIYLYDAHTTVPNPNGFGPPVPQLLKRIPLGRSTFSQPTFADGYLFVAGEGRMMAYAPAVARARLKAQLSKQLVPSDKAAAISALLKHRGFTYSFRMPSAGAAVISWYYLPKGARISRRVKPVLVAAGRKRFSAETTAKFTVKLTAVGRRILKSAKRLRLTVKGTYISSSSSTVSAKRTLTLRR